MRHFIPLLLVPLVCSGAEHWYAFTSGPFEVWTDAGSRTGRETLIRFEQFRNALGQLVGEPDLKAEQPVRILLFRSAKDMPQSQEAVIAGRDRYDVLLANGAPVSPRVFRELTEQFLAWNTARMPAKFERGLADLFSTIEVTGIRATLGKPPQQPNLDWARVHLLATSPEYYGKLRVILYNLRKGVEEGPAYRNAVAKSAEQIDQEAKQYFAAGNFPTIAVSARPMTERDFPEKPLTTSDVQLATADLLLDARLYDPVMKDHPAEAHEGLGLIALRDKQSEKARAEFAAAISAGSRSARDYLEYARVEPDHTKALKALQQAVQINPKLAEPHYLIAQHESDVAKKIPHLKQATVLDPRNVQYWQALAETYLAEKNFAEAAKAWHGAEQAATTPEQRARMRQAWLSIDQQRLDYEAAEKKRIEEENAREIAKLKQQAVAHVRELEAKANAGQAASGDKPVAWWDGPKPSGRAAGDLKQIDCLGKQLRLTVESGNKPVRLLIADPGQIAIAGGGEQTLSCGPQKGRRVVVEYFPKANARLGTAGDVATIEFQ